MKQYDLILWGWDQGNKHRTREPIAIQLEKPLYQGQTLKPGDVPELDALEPRYPVTVDDVRQPESPASDRAFDVIERKPVPNTAGR
ncbi:MAG: hypothetical protein U9Q35_00855 [Pseudomonadota bacterium]|nr:hypothetical protein [Pseudomonadota bacterium]